MTLYELTGRGEILEDLVEDSLNSEFANELVELRDQVRAEHAQKSDAVAALLLNWKAEEKMVREEAGRLSERARALKVKQERLKDMVRFVAEEYGLDRFVGKRFRITVGKPVDRPKVVDMEKLERKWWRIQTTLTPDLTLIANTIKEGGEVPEGVEMVATRSVRVR